MPRAPVSHAAALPAIADRSRKIENEFGAWNIFAAKTVSYGWSRDVTVDIADELRRRLVEYGEIAESAILFMEANRR